MVERCCYRSLDEAKTFGRSIQAGEWSSDYLLGADRACEDFERIY
jgi:hypothetical protein